MSFQVWNVVMHILPKIIALPLEKSSTTCTNGCLGVSLNGIFYVNVRSTNILPPSFSSLRQIIRSPRPLFISRVNETIILQVTELRRPMFGPFPKSNFPSSISSSISDAKLTMHMASLSIQHILLPVSFLRFLFHGVPFGHKSSNLLSSNPKTLSTCLFTSWYKCYYIKCFCLQFCSSHSLHLNIL